MGRWFNQAGPGEVAVDGRGRDGGLVGLQVPGDGVGFGIETYCGEFLAQLHDQGDRRVIGGFRGGLRALGAGLECRSVLGAVSGDELGDPVRRDPVFAGDLGLGPALEDDGGDDQTGFRHAPDQTPKSFQ
nr:hypothetical protein [Glycomyces tenuis]